MVDEASADRGRSEHLGAIIEPDQPPDERVDTGHREPCCEAPVIGHREPGAVTELAACPPRGIRVEHDLDLTRLASKNVTLNFKLSGYDVIAMPLTKGKAEIDNIWID